MTPMECLRKSRTPSTEFCLQENSANISPCLKKTKKELYADLDVELSLCI